jgi:hypothetical protein
LIGADRDPVNWSVPSKFNVFSMRPVETGKELSIALRDLIKRRFDRDRVHAPGQRLQAHTSCLQSNAPSGAFITRMVMKASSLASQTHPFALLKTTAFDIELDRIPISLSVVDCPHPGAKARAPATSSDVGAIAV